MSEGKLSDGGATPWVKVTGPSLFSVNGTFGGGTIAFNKRVDGTEYPLYDAGAAITLTAPDDISLALGQNVAVRLVLSGSTGANIKYAIKSQK